MSLSKSKLMAISIKEPVFLHELGKRGNNEDSIYPNDGAATSNDRLFVVCDEVGGANKGEIASRMVCDLFHAYFVENPPVNVDSKYIHEALKFTEQKLSEYADKHPECNGMSTTLTLLYLDNKQNKATMAWVGDSRIYHIRNGKIKFVTDDHSLVGELVKRGEITKEEALTHPNKNVILRAISGDQMPTLADVVETNDLMPGDYFLLCSDGILESVDERILLTLLKDKKSDLIKVREQIKELCGQYSYDNHSMYLLQIEDVDDSRTSGKIADIPTEEKTIEVEKDPAKSLEKSNRKLIYLLATAALGVLLFVAFYQYQNIKKQNELREYKKAIELLLADGDIESAQETLFNALEINKNDYDLVNYQLQIDSLEVIQFEREKEMTAIVAEITGQADSIDYVHLGTDSASLQNFLYYHRIDSLRFYKEKWDLYKHPPVKKTEKADSLKVSGTKANNSNNKQQQNGNKGKKKKQDKPKPPVLDNNTINTGDANNNSQPEGENDVD